jgi:hypothetical protein
MPGNLREIVTMAERRFPVRIRIGVPPSGFGQRYTEITEWLDGNCVAGNRNVAEIRYADVDQLHRKITATGAAVRATARWRRRDADRHAGGMGSARRAVRGRNLASSTYTS